jgi:ABC-type maltose transport system permease subunit
VSPDLLVPIISSVGCLVLCGAALASYRLKGSQMVKMAVIWLAIFVGLYALVAWFLTVQSTASTLM